MHQDGVFPDVEKHKKMLDIVNNKLVRTMQYAKLHINTITKNCMLDTPPLFLTSSTCNVLKQVKHKTYVFRLPFLRFNLKNLSCLVT